MNQITTRSKLIKIYIQDSIHYMQIPGLMLSNFFAKGVSRKHLAVLLDYYHKTVSYTEPCLEEAANSLLNDYSSLSRYYQSHLPLEKGHAELAKNDKEGLGVKDISISPELNNKIKDYYGGLLSGCRTAKGAISYFSYMYIAELFHVTEHFVETVENSEINASHVFKSMRIHASEDEAHIALQNEFLDSGDFPENIDFKSYRESIRKDMSNVGAIIMALVKNLSEI